MWRQLTDDKCQAQPQVSISQWQAWTREAPLKLTFIIYPSHHDITRHKYRVSTHKTSRAVRSRYNSEMIQERNVAGTFSVLLQFIWHNSNELLIFRASAPHQWPRRPSPVTIIIVITRNMTASPHLPHLPDLNLNNGWGWVLLCTTTDTTTIDNWMEQWWRGWGQRCRVQTSVQSRYSRYSRIMNNNQNQLATKIQLEGDTYMIGRSALWIVSRFLWCNMKRF